MARRVRAARNDKKKKKPASSGREARLRTENARLKRNLAESLRQQAATADVLKVISRSTFDLNAVLQTLVESAARLCDAELVNIWRPAGGSYRLAASFGVSGKSREWTENVRYLAGVAIEPGRGSIVGRALLEKATVQIADAQSDPEYGLSEIVRIGDYRTMLAVPLLREGEPVGVLVLTRCTVQAFSEKHVELVNTFADQAVIAIENARLLTEVRDRTRDLEETLQFQMAGSDVLKVISRSPDMLQPVLDTIAETSRSLCGAEASTIFLLRDDAFHVVATAGTPHDVIAYLNRNPITKDQRGSSMARAAREKRSVHIPDTSADPEFALGGPVGVGPARSTLTVPLIQRDEVIGGIILRQRGVTAFTRRQIEVVETFADQAVIAINNTRLFNETREALEQQTATADILKVIASSPSDVQPVFQAIAERSNRLVSGLSTTVLMITDDVLELASFTPTNPEADAALIASFPRRLSAMIFGDSVLAGEIYALHDTEEEPSLRDLARLRGYRSMLFVPLVKDGVPIGAIGQTRVEAGPFAAQHVQLLKTFADQAVIAISNVRLFQEVQQRTRELSQSLDDLRSAQDRLIQTEKLASLGQLTAGIAHEIKNPLNFVNNFSALSAELIDEMSEALAQAELDPARRNELDELTRTLKGNLERVVQHGKRADSIVKNMLLHSREGSGERRPADINAIVDESLNLAYHGARAEKPGFNIALERKLDPAAGQISVFPQEITRVLLNIISNGFYAATSRAAVAASRFEPALSAETRNLGDRVEIRLRDNGTGIPPEVKARIFTPFFTTKPPGEGTGLGLSMSHDIIVKQHGGMIDVDTEPGMFTEFIITLPRQAAGNK